MKIELKNIKHLASLSEETECFTATLWLDGKRAADVANRGHGGPNEFHFKDRELEQAFYDYCKAQPAEQTEYGPLKMDADFLVANLLATELEKKQLRRLCAKQTLFRCAGETYKPGEYTVIKMKFSPQVKAHIAAKYGDATILNESL